METKIINTPSLRFPKYTDQWKVKKLSDIGQFKKGGSLAKSDLCLEGRPCILYGELYTQYKTVINHVFSKTNVQKKNDVFGQVNDVLIPSSGETAFDIACASTLAVGNVSLGGDMNVFRPQKDANGAFISFQINSVRKRVIAKLAQGASVVHLYSDSLRKVSINLPSLEEQQAIASFLTLMDQRIEKQQEKIQQLELFKKAMMQKVFSREIRFKDDNGQEFPEWNRKSLNKIVERVTRKNRNLESTLPLTISAQHGLVDQITFFNKTVASTNLEGYYLLYSGEFAYNKSYSKGYPFGAIKRLHSYDKGVLSNLYICFKSLNLVVDEYLEYYFESTFWHKEISMISVEGARNHGLLNISVSDFFETVHKMPCYKEQLKIAGFFSTINGKIENEHQIMSCLSDMKRGLLQQMLV
ncbi:type I restriction enzyme S subunit [Paenibacillus anaericanus]|uniref:restriction endonuclease subunit S n=1 Tax=Paenibacillus anaericanus TaxID=170367 RepID=UPI00277F1D44|nr:restriction endonuclease subunit S [Paenibacillus anaericanus]MDQ0086728.1 type I restriction enzyme S subunit [Paenibacillus anaericanus]